LADVDGDGRLDLLTGSDDCCDRQPGFFWFRSEEDGRFSARPKVLVRFPEDFRPCRLRAVLADWDGDGRAEVVAVLSPSGWGLQRSDGNWSLDEDVTTTRQVSGGPDDLNHQPCIVDWDGDGRLDLIAVTDRRHENSQLPGYEVSWYRNNAPRGEPRLIGPRQLFRFSEGESVLGVSAGDWDDDGWPDLIVSYVKSQYNQNGVSQYVAPGVRVYPRQPAR
jgi:hypothetical protein